MQTTGIQRRTVAIVGRPNVGKSSIFNRLGARMAIVHAERGVTRDRMVQEAVWKDGSFDLIDTGGLGRLDEVEGGKDAGELENSVRRQIETAVDDACAVIFVTDIEAGLIPQDEDVADFLRKSGKPVFLAANKADNAGRDAGVSDFLELGFPVFPVSALHFRGFEPLMDAVMERLPAVEKAGPEKPVKIAVVGHPNVGKSSFINRMLGCDRVIVSGLPGTTRDSVDVPFTTGSGKRARHYVLTDTAGIRAVRKIKGAVERFSLKSTERGIGRSDVAALVLDAVEGPIAQDKRIASLIMAHQKGCVILVNKWDLNRNATAASYRDALKKAFPFLDFVPVVFVSATTGFNIKRALGVIERVADHSNVRFPTGVLNRVIKQACDKKPLPIVKGKRLRSYYAVQVGTAPITVALFVNFSCRLDPAYESYLARVLRRSFKLEGVPVLFELRRK